MTEHCWLLTIEIGSYNPTRHTFAFKNKDAALAQLALLESKMGYKFRNDPAEARHRIVCDDGEAVIVMDDVKAARVVDEIEFINLTEMVEKAKTDRIKAFKEASGDAP